MRCKMEYEKLPEADFYAVRDCFSIFEAAFLAGGYAIPLGINSRGNVIFSKRKGDEIKRCLEKAPAPVQEVLALFAPAVRLDINRDIQPIAKYILTVFAEKKNFDRALKENPQESFHPLMEKAFHGRGEDILRYYWINPNERNYFPHSMLIPIPRKLLKDFFISIKMRPPFLFRTANIQKSPHGVIRAEDKKPTFAAYLKKRFVSILKPKGNIIPPRTEIVTPAFLDDVMVACGKGHPPSEKTIQAAWKSALTELGLTPKRGRRKAL